MKNTILSLLTIFPLYSAPVILTEQGVKNLGLETAVVEESTFETTVFALARTESIPEQRSVLSSRIPGRVAETNLVIGSYVTKGDKLLLLESRQPGDPPPSVWLTAPSTGTIVAINTSLGAPVEPSDRLAEIADLSKMYLIATLPQATAGKIKQGAIAHVTFPVRPEKSYKATLLKFTACPCPDPACALGQDTSKRSNSHEDADLNSAGVVFTIENANNQLRPGMTAECTIVMDQADGVMSVPRVAVHGSTTDRHVYVKHTTIPNAFDKVSVQIGRSNHRNIEIIDGLFPGDEVATSGSYSLGFAGAGGGPSLKEALDAAHGHEHNEDGSEMTQEQKAAKHQDNHATHEAPSRTRETFFMMTSIVLALLLLIMSLRRRQQPNETAELT